MRSCKRLVLIMLATATVATLVPTASEAQRGRRVSRRQVRSYNYRTPIYREVQYPTYYSGGGYYDPFYYEVQHGYGRAIYPPYPYPAFPTFPQYPTTYYVYPGHAPAFTSVPPSARLRHEEPTVSVFDTFGRPPQRGINRSSVKLKH